MGYLMGVNDWNRGENFQGPLWQVCSLIGLSCTTTTAYYMLGWLCQSVKMERRFEKKNATASWNFPDITSHRDQMSCHHIWVAKSTVITGVLDLWLKHVTIYSNGIKTKDDAKFPQGQTSMSSLVFDGTGNLKYLDLMAFYIFLRFSHPVFFWSLL